MNKFIEYPEDLIYGSLTRKLTAEEEERLNLWLSEPGHQELYQRISDKEVILRKMDRMDHYRPDEAWERLSRQLGNKKKVQVKWYWYAASLMLPVLFAGLLLYRYLPETPVEVATVSQDSIIPGSQNARVVLAGGEVMYLKKDTAYAVRQVAGLEIKNENGAVSFEDKGASAVAQSRYNQLETPRGGEYHVILPDGTKVWMNAESTLRFPSSFTGDVRRVYMTGEAYFEVAHQAGKPFIVDVDGMDVKVLGTKFNIRSYKGNPTTTTLLSGKVQLNSQTDEVVLSPGEQAVSGSVRERFKVGEADLNAVMGWINGIFFFDNETLENIMEELGRWYDVNVFFVNSSLQDERFSVEMPRHGDFKSALELIAKTGSLHLEIRDRTVFIK